MWRKFNGGEHELGACYFVPINFFVTICSPDIGRYFRCHSLRGVKPKGFGYRRGYKSARQLNIFNTSETFRIKRIPLSLKYEKQRSLILKSYKMKSISLLAAFLFAGLLFVQAQEKTKEAEQIIITKKGTGNEKLNIVIDGDKVTLNGEPVRADKDGNVTITRRKIKDMAVWNADGSVPGERPVIIRQPPMPQFPNKAMLGVITQKNDLGAEVMNVTEESAAAKAGLKQGDIIIEVDKNKIETPDDLSKAISDKNPGDKITIAYLRNKKQYTAIVELTKWSTPEGWVTGDGRSFTIPAMPNFDIEEFRGKLGDLQNKQRNLRQYNYDFPNFSYGSPASPTMGIKIQDTETDGGVKIIEVRKGSDAAKAGLAEGDIIKEVNGTTVRNTDTMMSAIRANRSNSSVKLKIERGGKTRNIDVIFTKKIKTADL